MELRSGQLAWEAELPWETELNGSCLILRVGKKLRQAGDRERNRQIGPGLGPGPRSERDGMRNKA